MSEQSELQKRAAALTEATERALASLESYTCTIVMRDRIKGKLMPESQLYTQYRKPGAVYLRWVGEQHRGMQASYVPGRDDEGYFMARESGLKGLIGARTWPQSSPLINTLYPHHFSISESSVVALTQTTLELQRRAHSLGKLRLESLCTLHDEELDAPVTKVVAQLSDDPGDGLRWPRCTLFICERHHLPLHVRLDDFDGGLFGEYVYRDFRPNVVVDESWFALPKR
ncbi:MAG: DUF1571 domain-containing protein [Myxococcota bacterium]|jgi:hypothetical protein|nr:DUF1571 domain-containing protein [Myxococcota bacterium]